MAGHAQYACHAGLSNWQKGWSDAKKEPLGVGRVLREAEPRKPYMLSLLVSFSRVKSTGEDL